MTKTWTLKLTPPDGPEEIREGLSDAEMLEALRRLTYGDFELPAEQADTVRLPLAA